MNYNLHKLNFQETAESCCEFVRPKVGPAFRIKLYSLLAELVVDPAKEFNLSVTINENTVLIESKLENIVDLNDISKIIENNTAETIKEKYKELCVKDTHNILDRICLSNLSVARLIMRLNAKIIEQSIIVNIPQNL